jgi:hypothetical protein
VSIFGPLGTAKIVEGGGVICRSFVSGNGERRHKMEYANQGSVKRLVDYLGYGKQHVLSDYTPGCELPFVLPSDIHVNIDNVTRIVNKPGN